MQSKILFLAGSARRDSFNKKLARQAYELALEKGGEASFVDLADYPMPLYDGDLEAAEGLPQSAIRLKQLFVEHQALFIASPEYNGSFSPLLKNSLDWISRPHQADEGRLLAYRGKVAALAATSAGQFGGLRGLLPLRMLLANIGVDVLGEQLAIPFYGKNFDRHGRVADAAALAGLDSLVDNLLLRTKQRAA